METEQSQMPNPDAQMGSGEAPTPEEIEAHMDSLEDSDKAFLAEHMTPEFVRAIALISGPEVGQYLDQFADKEKVLIPVPRQVAEQYLAEQQAKQGSPSAPQGGTPPSPAPAPVQGMPQQGMMTPPR